MPEELPPPKTIEEMGIHFVYLRKAQNDTSNAIKEVNATLKEMRDGSITRKEFDEQVIHCDGVLNDHERRLKKIETENQSTMHKVLRQMDSKIVVIIVTVLLGSFLYSAYIMLRYNNIIQQLPGVEITNK